MDVNDNLKVENCTQKVNMVTSSEELSWKNGSRIIGQNIVFFEDVEGLLCQCRVKIRYREGRSKEMNRTKLSQNGFR